MAYGDKAIGTNHVLPTMGAAPLHRRPVGRLVPAHLHLPAADARGHARASPPAVAAISHAEGFAGHARTAELRLAAAGRA